MGTTKQTFKIRHVWMSQISYEDLKYIPKYYTEHNFRYMTNFLIFLKCYKQYTQDCESTELVYQVSNTFTSHSYQIPKLLGIVRKMMSLLHNSSGFNIVILWAVTSYIYFSLLDEVFLRVFLLRTFSFLDWLNAFLCNCPFECIS